MVPFSIYVPDIFCPLTYFDEVGFGMGIMVLRGGALKGMYQSLAVAEYRDMPTSNVIVEVSKGLLYSLSFAPK